MQGSPASKSKFLMPESAITNLKAHFGDLLDPRALSIC
jgi:hypothetical protein